MHPIATINVSPTPRVIGLGCKQFSQGEGNIGRAWPTLTQAQIDDIVGAALYCGINFFDTAEAYGEGRSERALARALLTHGARKDEVVVADKWWSPGRTSLSILETFKERKRAVAPYNIQLHQVHRNFAFASTESLMQRMAMLRLDRSIRAIGVCNYSPNRMRAAFDVLQRYDIFLSTNQVRYNLLDRRADRRGLFEIAKELGVIIIAHSPLEQGLLSGRYHKNPDDVKKLSRWRRRAYWFRPEGLKRSAPLIELLDRLGAKYEATPAQISLNWLVNAHPNLIVIPGATKPEQVIENVLSLSFTMSEEDMETLNQMSLTVTAE